MADDDDVTDPDYDDSQYLGLSQQGEFAEQRGDMGDDLGAAVSAEGANAGDQAWGAEDQGGEQGDAEY
jgi:hypothetical protein